MSEAARSRVLLLHGWGGTSASTWRDGGLAGALAAFGHEVLTLDLPGHGPGEHSHDPADYGDLASALETALPAGEVLDGVGFSLGAKVLLELVVREPDRFRRLVLAGLGGNAFAPESAGEAVADALQHGVAGDTPAVVRALVDYAIAAGNDPRALAACLRRPANPVLSPQRLGEVTCPVLLIAGGQDALAQPVAPLADALAAVEIATLPGVTHLGLPCDENFRRHVGAFLRKEDG